MTTSLNRLLGVFLVVTAAGCLAGVGTASAAFPGDNGRIAFERHSSGGGSVVTVGADGTDVTVLGPGLSPAWSADGARIAFRGYVPGTFRTTIFVMNADGSGVVEVGPQFDDPPGGRDYSYSTIVDNPAWSPDGTRIAYQRNVIFCGGHACVEQPEGIWVINIDGTGERQVAETGNSPVWSPDGTKIAFHTGAAFSSGDIAVVGADGWGQVELTSSETNDRDPNWSPDGAKLVFTTSPELFGSTAIEVITADGTPLGRLVEAGLGNAPAWSPDGTKVVFRSGRDGGGLFTVKADGSEIARLAESGTRDFDPDWQPLVGPRRADFKNAAHFCKAERAFLGDAKFAAKYGNGANAHGKCVSSRPLI